jgi:hypothetical protein
MDCFLMKSFWHPFDLERMSGIGSSPSQTTKCYKKFLLFWSQSRILTYHRIPLVGLGTCDWDISGAFHPNITCCIWRSYTGPSYMFPKEQGTAEAVCQNGESYLWVPCCHVFSPMWSLADGSVVCSKLFTNRCIASNDPYSGMYYGAVSNFFFLCWTVL